jgi:MoxR-like ATPase
LTDLLSIGNSNPIEQEGTYQSEAQVDRFMLKTVIDYPKMDEERMVVRQNLKGSYEKVNQVVSVEQILRAQEAVREVYMEIEKIYPIFFATDTQKI